MRRLKRFLLFLLGESRFVTVQQLYDAVNSGMLHADMPHNSPAREGHIKLISKSVSIFYLETFERGRRVESIDIHAFAHRGGAWVTFVDDGIVQLTHNMIKRVIFKITPDESRMLLQIMLKVRRAANS